MSYDLTGQKISYTYGRVVQVVSGSYYDGFGNVLPIGTSSVILTGSTNGFATTGSNTFIGNQIVSGSVIVTNGITGSLQGTSSYSTNTLSASYSLTSSYSNTSSYSDTSLSASYAVTASYAFLAENANNATNSQNAQDILVYVKNTTGTIIPKGKLVRIVGVDNSSSNPTIALADFINDANSANTLGYTNETFSINGFGYVITEGRLIGVDTSAFTSGDLLYLSSSGTITNVVPVAPKHGVRVGQVIRSQQNNGSIYVTIDNGAELEELHNVIDTSTTSSYGDLLVRSGSVWINSKNLTGSYTLSGSLTTNDGINCISVTASLYGTSSWSNNSLTASYVVTAQTASYYNGTVISSSYSLSSSFAPTNTNITASWSVNSLTSSYVTLAQSASYYNGSVISSSYSNNSQLLNNTSSTIFAITGSNTFTGNQTVSSGYVILSQVSASLNFVDDTAAAAGGVPLGGLYRNGNFILIRLT